MLDPVTKRTLVIPGVTVPPGESLWLPLDVSLGPDGLCRECSNFSAAEHIVYATAELLSVEFENGILAMEFAAPAAGRGDSATGAQAGRPVSWPAGKPTEFDWDDKTPARAPADSRRARRRATACASASPSKSPRPRPSSTTPAA